ncbi:MAG: alpha/beta hydrolase [Alphaproteobacteria bacterium]
MAKERLEQVVPSPAIYGAGTPMAATAERTHQSAVLYIPGEGTSFAENAERAAQLQAELGPDTEVLLAQWASRRGPRGYLKNDLADTIARGLISDALAELVSVPEEAVSVVAEGRGARILVEAFGLERVPENVRERVTTLVLIAPQLSEKDFAGFIARFDRARTRIAVYTAEAARPLLAARAVYGADPVGLRPTPTAGLKGVEWIQTGIGEPTADFATLGTDALFRDIGTVIRGGPPADRRCALAKVSEARSGDAYVLNPQGCEGGPAGAAR